MSHCIFHFRTRNKSTQIYTHGTMERLRSNLSHILGSRREMVIKVFSKFAGSLRQGETEGTLRKNGSLSCRLTFFSLGKTTLLLSPREHTLWPPTILLEASPLPSTGTLPVPLGERAKFRWQNQLPQESISNVFYLVAWPSPKLPFAEGLSYLKWHFTLDTSNLLIFCFKDHFSPLLLAIT